MERSRHKRWSDEVARVLLAPLLSAPLSQSGWRLVSWDAEQGITVSLAKGATVLLVELEARDDARPCFARTRYFNATVRRQFQATSPLTEEDRAVTEALLSMVRRQEAAFEIPERAVTGRRTDVRLIEVDRVLMPEGQNHYYLNPYVGCMIGCSFCYVMDRADLSRRLEALPALPWGSWVDVKVNAPEVLAREIERLPPGLVRMSPIVTDPYMPLERRFRITRRCLELLLPAGFRPVVLTRAARVTADLDLLRAWPNVAVGLSIPTNDDRWRQLFEPGGDPVEERFEALEQLAAAGVSTFAVIQPMLPMDTDRMVERLGRIVRAIRVDRMYDTWRVQHLYRQGGIEWAAEDAFFEQTEAALRHGFADLGIPVDDLDDLAPLVTRDVR